LGRFFGGNRATRGASNEARGSGALSGGRSVGAIAALLAIVALALVPAFASAITTHPVTGFSPINGSGTGVTFNFPSGIAVDESNGNVFVNDGFPNEAVDIFNAEGGVPAGVASPYQIIGFNFSSNPSGVAVDNSATSPSKGALYVTRVGSPLYQVGKFVRNAGTQLYEPAGTLTPTSGPAIEYPMGVAVDSKGNVFVADFSNASVIEFSPTGTQLGRINT
jgi:DNA-binding beta-propeller fold protein YncE